MKVGTDYQIKGSVLFVIVVFAASYIAFAADRRIPEVPVTIVPFDEQWNGAAALLAFDEWPKPKMVKTISYKPEEDLLPEPPPPEAKVWHQRKPPQDICRGKGRNYYNGGRTWRCRR
jgi:outer membrane biosynthesis protein TonB